MTYPPPRPELLALLNAAKAEYLLTNRGAVALAGASHLGTLEELNLRRNNIAGKEALALANSPHLTQLRRLDLSANRTGVKAGDALRERFGTCLVLT